MRLLRHTLVCVSCLLLSACQQGDDSELTVAANSDQGDAVVSANTVQNHVTEVNQCTDVQRLSEAVADSRRRDQAVARDSMRHPQAVLEFFDVKPEHTVVEIWPSGGWWTEILSPYLRDCGEYIAAGFSLEANRTPGWRKRAQRDYNAWLNSEPERFDQVKVSSLAIPEYPEIAPPGTADRVLTFRNVHNWMNGSYAPEVFVSMYSALKPGGVLGLVEHRAVPGTSREQMLISGYISEVTVIKMAEAAGFELIEQSDINANLSDTKDHPAGVWSLPPSLRLGEQDREKYIAIGESDRMTLKFRKPAE